MPLLSVYNNLIHGYVMSRQTRFDSHKRSELSDIYNKIRKISAEQPLYKIDFDDDVQEYTLTVKEQAMALTAAVKELSSGDAEGTFGRFTMRSDMPGTVGVEVLEGSDLSDYDALSVDVEQLSAPQVNEGRMIESKENSLVAGQYHFTVEIEKSYYSFQFNVSGQNNNKELQTKLADFINKTKVGLRANVVSDRENGTSALNLEAKKDGVEFVFKDTKIPDGTNSGIVDFFGLNNVVHKAEKTVAVINGDRIESDDRKYVTSEGLLLDFKRTTNGKPVNIRKIADDETVYRKVSDFVNKFNSLSDYVHKGAQTRRASKKLWMDMNRILSNYSDELSDNGLNVVEGERPELHLDREKMSEAVNNGTLEKMFRSDSEVVGSILKKLSEVSLNPMDYVDKTIVVYPNTRSRFSYNPYITSIYSGMMYNNYC